MNCASLQLFCLVCLRFPSRHGYLIHWKLHRKGVSWLNFVPVCCKVSVYFIIFTVTSVIAEHLCLATASHHLPSHTNIIVVICCTNLKHLTPSKVQKGATTPGTRPEYMLVRFVSVVIWLWSLLCWQTRWSSAFAVGKALKPSNATSSYRHSCKCYGWWGHVLTHWACQREALGSLTLFKFPSRNDSYCLIRHINFVV